MKTKKLIKLLQEQDPTGEAIVIGYDGEIYAPIKLPWYYDGKPGVMLRDTDDQLIGYQEMDETFTSGKIYLYGFGDDHAGERWEHDSQFIVKGSPTFVEKIKKHRKQYKELRDNLTHKKIVPAL